MTQVTSNFTYNLFYLGHGNAKMSLYFPIRSKTLINHITFTPQNLLHKSFTLSVWEKHFFKMVRNHITIVLILSIFSTETLASPVNLEVSIKGVQNGNTVERSAGVQISNASLTLPNNKTLIDWKCDEDNMPDQSCIKQGKILQNNRLPKLSKDIFTKQLFRQGEFWWSSNFV